MFHIMIIKSQFILNRVLYNMREMWHKTARHLYTPGYCLIMPDELPKYCHDKDGSCS